MEKSRGLVGQLQEESYLVIKSIFLKYLRMRKRHLSKNRIAGIIMESLSDAIKDAINEISNENRRYL